MLLDGSNNEEKYVCAMLILHVDDILLGGESRNEKFKEAVKKLKTHFNFGKWDQLGVNSPIKYCGGTIIQGKEGLELSYEEYMRKVCPLTIQKTRRNEDKIQEGEMSKARGLVGALQWPSTQGMPALAASVSIQAGELAGGDVQTLHDLNKTLRFAKSNAHVRLRFLARDEDGEGIKGLTAIMFADAAFDVVKCPMSTVSWRSFKLPRVCRSSLAAECQSLSSSLEELMMAKAFLAKLQRPLDELKYLKDDLKQDCAVITDCKALYDCIQRETIQQATDKRVAIEALVIKDLLKDLACQWKWISSERQLADGLTKIGARQSFVERYKGGYVQLVSDETYTAAKKKTKEQRARTLQETRGSKSTVAQALIAYAMAEAPVAKGHEMNDEKKEDYVFMVFVTIGAITVATVLWFGWKMMMKGYEWCQEMWYYKEKAEKRKQIEAENEEMKKLNVTYEKRIEKLEEQLEKLCYTNSERAIYKERCDANIQELMHVLESQVTIEKDNAEYFQRKYEDETGKTEQMEARFLVMQQRIDVLQTEKYNLESRMRELSRGRHEVLITTWGRVWHADRDCHHLRQSQGVSSYAPCTSCVGD